MLNYQFYYEQMKNNPYIMQSYMGMLQPNVAACGTTSGVQYQNSGLAQQPESKK
jgi:hypothetical protein